MPLLTVSGPLQNLMTKSCFCWGVLRSSNQNLASIQPPLDSHGQNLLLHSIELKHHIRKMMLMKMAAQHQQAGGNVSNLKTSAVQEIWAFQYLL